MFSAACSGTLAGCFGGRSRLRQFAIDCHLQRSCKPFARMACFASLAGNGGKPAKSRARKRASDDRLRVQCQELPDRPRDADRRAAYRHARRRPPRHGLQAAMRPLPARDCRPHRGSAQRKRGRHRARRRRLTGRTSREILSKTLSTVCFYCVFFEMRGLIIARPGLLLGNESTERGLTCAAKPRSSNS